MMEWAVTASALTAAVILLRAVFRKRIGRKLQYAIWAVVLVRLLVPFSLFTSPVSVMGALPLPDRFGGHPVVLQPTEQLPAAERPDRAAKIPAQPNQPGPPDSPLLKDAESFAFKPNLEEILGMAWAAGAVLAGIWFLGTNLLFAFRLKRTRRRFPVSDCSLPVYLTNAAVSPCLFGVFRPAVYLTPKAAETPQGQKHVIAHELCHRRQGDHIWSLLRGLCIALWWWNPLVWAAAVLSRTDSELACDEAAIRLLGEGSRLDYGRTLVGMIAVKDSPSGLLCAATTMSAGKRGIKERITMIVKHPRSFLPAAIAAALLAGLFAGCAFAGPEPATGPEAGGTLAVSIACGESVYEIAWDAGGASGGATNADNTPFAKGDLVTLDFSGPMEYTIQALGKNGAPLAEAAFSDVFEEGARIELTLTADLQFVRPEQPAAEPTYAILHAGAGGELLSVVSLPDSHGAELAKNIIADDVLKSAAWPGGDVSALSDYYIIRQSFPGETHDYYAYIVTEGEVTGAVLQRGEDGFYSRISDGLYRSLVDYMDGIEKGIPKGEPPKDLAKKQADRLAEHLLEFAESPRGEGLNGQAYSGDWDGDGRADRASIKARDADVSGYSHKSQVVVELGSGERIIADSGELEQWASWGGRGFLIESGDLTGDGQNEILLMIDLGGRGGYGLYPYAKTENGWALMDAPYQGFSLALDYKDGNAAVTSGAYSEIVADGEMLRAHYAAGNGESEWERIKGVEYHKKNAADPICDIALAEEDGKTLVKLSQYVTGMTGVRVDGLGYLVTTLSWDAKGAFSVKDMRFVLWPQ